MYGAALVYGATYPEETQNVSHLNSLNSTVPPLWIECFFLSIAVVKTETRLSTFNFWVESSTR